MVKLTHIFRVFIEAERDKLLESFRVATLELRRVALWDKKQDPHWVVLGMRGFPFCQLYSRDPKRPDVSLYMYM